MTIAPRSSAAELQSGGATASAQSLLGMGANTNGRRLIICRAADQESHYSV